MCQNKCYYRVEKRILSVEFFVYIYLQHSSRYQSEDLHKSSSGPGPMLWYQWNIDIMTKNRRKSGHFSAMKCFVFLTSSNPINVIQSLIKGSLKPCTTEERCSRPLRWPLFTASVKVVAREAQVSRLNFSIVPNSEPWTTQEVLPSHILRTVM